MDHAQQLQTIQPEFHTNAQAIVLLVNFGPMENGVKKSDICSNLYFSVWFQLIMLSITHSLDDLFFLALKPIKY